MSKKQLEYVRQLIQQQRYNEARVILQSLAAEDETARQWLAKLNTIAPPQPVQVQVTQRQGCLSGIISGIAAILGGSMLAIALVGCVILVCCGAITVIGYGISQQQDQNQKDALIANAGRGDTENPIPAGQPVIFQDFSITPLEIIRPATNENRFLRYNEPPAAGTDYVLVRFRMDCKKAGSTVCRGFDFKVRLVDANGAEWGEPTIFLLEDDLDDKEVIGGSAVEGWQVFEFPQNGTLNLIKLWVDTEATLYTIPPAQ